LLNKGVLSSKIIGHKNFITPKGQCIQIENNIIRIRPNMFYNRAPEFLALNVINSIILILSLFSLNNITSLDFVGIAVV
jgi:hypothetical protein